MAWGKIMTSKAVTLYSNTVMCVASAQQRQVAIGARTTAHTHVYDAARGHRANQDLLFLQSDMKTKILLV